MATGSLLRAFTVLLVMSCPCATVLAASTAITAAIANAARRGVLVKGGLYLERFGEADCFCFDKTGTVTTEQPRVVNVISRRGGLSPERLLELAAIAESHSQHPLARAVLAAAKEREIGPLPDAELESVLGRGVRARVGEEAILVGSARFLEDEGVGVGRLRRRARLLSEAGRSVLYVAKDGVVEGLIGVASSVRPGIGEVLDWLRRDGVSAVYLITGDEEPAARAVTESLGFDEFRAAMLPEEKAQFVEELGARGRRVVVVGDGVNDTPAFARAAVGLAMGVGGAEAAIEVADVALLRGDLEQLVALRQLSHQALRVIEQNHWLAVGTNLVGVVLAATGQISPALGGALHLVHTLGIVANSSRMVGWEVPGYAGRAIESSAADGGSRPVA